MKLTRWVAVALVTLALVAGGLYYAARGLPFATNVPVGGARLLEPDLVSVFLECGRDASATANEDQTTVTVQARLKIRPGDCGTEAWVRLDGPFGDRTLIDAYDGEEIPIDR